MTAFYLTAKATFYLSYSPNLSDNSYFNGLDLQIFDFADFDMYFAHPFSPESFKCFSTQYCAHSYANTI
jgi:hypothetical protein